MDQCIRIPGQRLKERQAEGAGGSGTPSRDFMPSGDEEVQAELAGGCLSVALKIEVWLKDRGCGKAWPAQVSE